MTIGKNSTAVAISAGHRSRVLARAIKFAIW
jgi:hypothetical protein